MRIFQGKLSFPFTCSRYSICKDKDQPCDTLGKSVTSYHWCLPRSVRGLQQNSRGRQRRQKIWPITEDQKCTWICEIKLTFVPSCSQMRLQLLHFHAVFKTWSTFQELTPIVSFRRRRWSQRNFSENRTIQGNQSKDMLSKMRGLRRNIFLASRRLRCCPRLLKVPILHSTVQYAENKISIALQPNDFPRSKYMWALYKLHITWLAINISDAEN